ncbi:Flp1 family type IVb pilin [Sinanaerobacter sp. ZZT-01]|uniref:Flp1 family type IVb pilin n=1 Tax=Sinanaerobacter sp. ZZT-01 TaxID=3111540 RepID=UPI002D76C708|nr:Flp1 family type IVb pilin [Sinanaerobacter sp. ZZT-01]WRR92900.1 Flp1 family type IVb pilin [Sinanaerobacter sp. ZZT-01]
MSQLIKKWCRVQSRMMCPNKKGMEMVQVAILVAIAVGLGLIFKERIGEFVTNTFDGLMNSGF